MELRLPVTVETGHALLIVNIRGPTVITGIFRVDAASMADGAGLAIVLLHELVSLDQPRADAADPGRRHVTIPAGRVAAPARLLEDLFVEYLTLFRGKPRHDPMP